MAHTDDARLVDAIGEIVNDGNTKDLFRRLLREALQELIEEELTAAIGAAPHERTDARSNQRHGGAELVVGPLAGRGTGEIVPSRCDSSAAFGAGCPQPLKSDPCASW